MPSFCAQILTEIMAASWVFVNIVGAIRPHKFWPPFFFSLKKEGEEVGNKTEVY